MSSAREPQLPLDTPDPLTCRPTAMTRAIAPLGGEGCTSSTSVEPAQNLIFELAVAE